MADLVYDFGVESLFKGLGPRLTPALKDKVRAVGIDLDKKLLPAYPKDLWVRVVDVVAHELNAGGELPAARRQLGHAIASGFAEGTLGRLMAPGVRLMGVRRMLLRLPRSLTMSNNFLRVTVTEMGPHAMRVELNEAVPSAEFLCGVIEAIAGYAGAMSCEVQSVVEGPLHVFNVTWA
ncbi:MAG: DUF2378 family protein [Archangium sp.]|nr:DUF2378 family protein [Archangium sp.]